MEEKIYNQNIIRLNMPQKVMDILNRKDISTIGELCSYSKSDLQKININGDEIKDISIQLQLMGLNLRNSL